MEGKRKRGRPKRGWTDDLIDYIQLSLDDLLEKSWRQDESKKSML